MTFMPPVHWDSARRIGARLAPLGPRLTAERVHEITDNLRSAARRAPELILAASGLGRLVDADTLVVDRRGWIAGVTHTAQAMLTRAVEASAPRRAQPDSSVHADSGRGRDSGLVARTNGAEVGAVLAMLSGRILGQFDPFVGTPRLMLVAPNVVKIADELDIAWGDFALWVCLHEQTHLVQFSNAEWLGDHLVRLASTMLEAESDMSTLDELRVLASRRRQGGIDSSMLGGEAGEALDAVTCAMSLLEGHADVMMDRAGREVLPGLPRIRARFDARRARGGVTAVLGRLVGLDVKMAQYRDGAKFCREVLKAGGVELMNRAFEGPELLPSRAELADADRWIARVGA